YYLFKQEIDYKSSSNELRKSAAGTAAGAFFVLDKEIESNIIKNQDRTGILLGVNSNYLSNLNDYISIYTIDNETLDISNINATSNEWSFNYTFKYKYKYFKNEQYNTYFDLSSNEAVLSYPEK
mgnify:CR=1